MQMLTDHSTYDKECCKIRCRLLVEKCTAEQHTQNAFFNWLHMKTHYVPLHLNMQVTPLNLTSNLHLGQVVSSKLDLDMPWPHELSQILHSFLTCFVSSFSTLEISLRSELRNILRACCKQQQQQLWDLGRIAFKIKYNTNTGSRFARFSLVW